MSVSLDDVRDVLSIASDVAGPLLDLARYVDNGTRTPEEDERHARALIRAAFDARAEREIAGA
jgi:hypothetical protein